MTDLGSIWLQEVEAWSPFSSRNCNIHVQSCAKVTIPFVTCVKMIVLILLVLGKYKLR